MKTHKFLAILLAVNLAGMAAVLDVDGNFKQAGSWIVHEWEGFAPYGKLDILPGADAGRNVLRFHDVNGKGGGAVHAKVRQPGRCGDTVRVSFRGRGRGQASVLLYFYGPHGSWNQSGTPTTVGLAREWGEYIVALPINNGTSGETEKFDVVFQVKQGEEIELSNVIVETVEGKYRGSLPLPQYWTLFAPVDKSFQPQPEDLTRVPQALGGARGVVQKLFSHTIDFAPLVGGKGAYKCGWAYTELNSPIDCEYTIGAGADWWMAYYVNGELAIDTSEKGNEITPYDITNYTKTVKLHKGKNILAVKLITGSGSSILKLGGPLDLRSITRKIKLGKISWLETFDTKTPSCGGNPEIIQGNPTPGLLSLTGQAVFKTASRLEINPPRRQYPIPAETGSYLALGMRIQNFGRDSQKDSALDFTMADASARFQLRVKHTAGNGLLSLETSDTQGRLEQFPLPVRLLPADFLLAMDRMGNYVISVNSLVDSTNTTYRGVSPFFSKHSQAEVGLVFGSNGGEAEIVTDNYLVGKALDESATSQVPYKIDLLPDFDPVKAGWKKVFDDEFDGDKLDESKWYHGWNSFPERIKVEDGKCVITCDWDTKHEKVTSASIYTYDEFIYGYYEARVKFRKEHGWWSAFWLCQHNVSNPFYDGFEIDIYEDYYLRPMEPGGKPRDILDHNLHINVGGTLKSWNYNSKLPGGLDQYYTIGCKWTPFEISYYLDGKLIASSANHSPHNSVTFDPFNHGGGFTPMKCILSGCCGKSGGDPKMGNFPESFSCDYVRVYAYPHDQDPQVKLTAQTQAPFAVKPGIKLSFTAEATPSPATHSPVKNVYLFDSGFLIDYKTEPPYTFDVIMNKEFYDTTDYVRPGRSGVRAEFGSQLHAFSIFAQDEAGRVAYTQPVLHFVRPTTPSKPYQGKPHPIPGKILLIHFDEGGNNVAYHDSTPGNSFAKGKSDPALRTDEDVDFIGTSIGGMAPWEWLNYTVDIVEEGTYSAKLLYGTPFEKSKDILLMCDGAIVGRFKIHRHEGNHFTTDTISETSVKIPAGRHVLTLLTLSGSSNINSLELTK